MRVASILWAAAVLSCATAEPKPEAAKPAEAKPAEAKAVEAKPAAAPPLDQAPPAAAAAGHEHAAAAPAAPPPPLFKDLGEWHHEIKTQKPEAQAYFDQGLRLMYGFNHDEAIRAFQQAAQLDPACAMCLWGIAVSLGPNINLPTDPEREKAAAEALQKAQPQDPRETAYVEAARKRYKLPAGPDRKALDQAYADAMRALAKQYPDDVDAEVLFAESMMDLRPWDFWARDGKPQPGTEEIVAALEDALKKAPKHPGANHFYIHIQEGSPHPERAVGAADRLPALMPGAGHIVHMPSHIYVHTGQYKEASAANEKAIVVDKGYVEREKPQGIYAMMYVAHNFQFLWATATMEGRSAAAIQAAREVQARLPEPMIREMAPMMAGIDYFVAPPLFALARFGRWPEVLAAPQPPADFKYLTVVWRFTRSLALAATGKTAEAQREAAELHTLAASLPKDAMLGPNNTAQAVFGVAEKMLQGELAARAGHAADAVKLLQEAVAAEDALGYDEPPPWYQPVRHSLGAVLLQSGRAKEAAEVYRADLRKNPGNGWALFGLAQSLKKLKDKNAGAAQADFEKSWARADVQLTASRF